ncbi:MAG: hypothetical protein ACYDCL_09825 [Myxococcales bacterium]
MRKNALVVLLAALPFGSCKCHGGLQGLNGTLVADPPSLSFDVAAHHTQTLTVKVTNQGTASVNITSLAVTGDTNKAFTPAPTYGPDAGPFLDIGGSTVLEVSYSPTAHQTDSATVEVDNDTGVPLDIAVTGKGEDPCFGVVCDAGLCFGSCDESTGACQYQGSCTDQATCLSSGTCNPTTGACEGTSDCQTGGPGPGTPGNACNVPAAFCNGNQLKGIIAPGNCNEGTGCCEYNTQPVQCDCGCVPYGNGSARCLYQWGAVPTPPPDAGVISTAWADGKTAGDVWVSEIPGTPGQIAPNTVYQLQSGTWNSVAQVAGAANYVWSGPSAGLILTGSSDQDVYGSADCTNAQGGVCQGGGAWHWTGSAADEAFVPATVPNAQLQQVADVPITPILDIGGTGFALNTDLSNVGPELVEGTGGVWHVAQSLRWGCEIAGGALWGISPSDIWIGWSCGSPTSTSGLLAHYNGSGMDSAKQFNMSSGDYALALWGTSDSDIWAAGTHRWHYDGSTWTLDAVAPPSGQSDNALWGDGSDYYAGGGYIQLYHWTAANDWTQECVYPGYDGPTITSFASDGTNVYATASPTGATTQGELVQRCPNGQCP